MNEQDLKKIFEARKVELPDGGFSERVIRQLPERKSMLPRTVMAVFIMLGLALTFAIQGFASSLEQINSFAFSISQLQIPSPISIVTYTSMLVIVVMIGFAVAHTDAG